MHLVTEVKEFATTLPLKKPNSKFGDADYLTVMCHEIGTPLTSIIGLSYILSDLDCSPQKKLECAQMLRDSSNMLLGLMKNMLDSSKMEAGKVEIENIDFNLVKVVQESVNIIANSAEEKKLHLHVHMAEGLPEQCMGDPQRIRQILLNLLSNAVKFTENGSVSLYVSAQSDAEGNSQLCITVTDTGIGISEAGVKKIFDKYTQANPAINREYGGMGLGLSISQDLAHLMHGDITVKSWPGMGSHFIVTLPLVKSMVLLEAA